MEFTFKFPDIGEGITEGKIIEWYVEAGQKVKSGQKVVKMETDKVVDDLPSPRTGVITARFGIPGDVIQVGKPLIKIKLADGQPGATIKEEKEEGSVGVVGNLEIAKASDVLPASDEGKTVAKAVPRTYKQILSTPAVRALARKHGISLAVVTGTGENGRIKKVDVQNYLSKYGARERTEKIPIITRSTKATSKQGEQTEELTQIRKTIAKRMILSKQSAAHMTVFEEVEISELAQLRSSQKEKFKAKGVSLTYLPFILKAVVEGLKQYRVLNSQLDMENNRITYKYDYNIGIAVDTDDGLIVPVIRNVDQMSIYDLSAKITDIAIRARDRSIPVDELRGGTFTITNFGAISGIYGTPILNYPEVGILGIGRARQLPVVKNNNIEIGTILPLSLSVDHRVIDGGEATRFLKLIMELLSDPVSLLLL